MRAALEHADEPIETANCALNQRFSTKPPGSDLSDITLLPKESVEPRTIALKQMNEGCVAANHLSGNPSAVPSPLAALGTMRKWRVCSAQSRAHCRRCALLNANHTFDASATRNPQRCFVFSSFSSPPPHAAALASSLSTTRRPQLYMPSRTPECRPRRVVRRPLEDEGGVLASSGLRSSDVSI